MNRQAFGRRNSQQREPHREREAAPPAAQIEGSAPAAHAATPDPVDEELRAWKAARRRQFPLRQFSLMASLCFGIASFALPEALNDYLQWPLYALAAASLYVGLSTRFGNGQVERAPDAATRSANARSLEG